MAISRAQLVKELEPGLNALFGLEYKRYENQHAHHQTNLLETERGSPSTVNSDYQFHYLGPQTRTQI